MDRARKDKEELRDMAEDIQVTIQRFQPGGATGPEETVYSVKYREGITLHNALQQIYQNLDSSLAFRPFSCNKGICMSCLVVVDGRTRQACTMLLKPGERLWLKAEQSRPPVRDLVTVPSEKPGTAEPRGPVADNAKQPRQGRR
jgi:succinate dehydrogenase/fumarate reductase-like Fe-S protein